MDSTVHMPKSETASIWTDEKHLHFLNSMEASFVRTMLHRHDASTAHLRLDRHLPDTADSTLDSKPLRIPKKNSLSDSMGPIRTRIESRRTKRKSSQLYNSSTELTVPQLVENGRESGGRFVGGDDQEQREK